MFCSLHKKEAAATVMVFPKGFRHVHYITTFPLCQYLFQIPRRCGISKQKASIRRIHKNFIKSIDKQTKVGYTINVGATCDGCFLTVIEK